MQLNDKTTIHVADELERHFNECNCKVILTNMEALQRVDDATRNLPSLKVGVSFDGGKYVSPLADDHRYRIIKAGNWTKTI